ncbi:unnamed protein product [Ascophyllum nodosum]
MGSLLKAWAVATATAAFGVSSSLAQAVNYVVSSCKDFSAIPTPMRDDTHVLVTQDIACKSPQTVIVSGPYAYLVSSDLHSLELLNLRFSVKDGADFFFSLSAEEYQGTAAFISTGEQQFHGGTFKIDIGSSATFGVPVTFSASAVVPGKRGGAIFNNGYLTFEQTAKFDNNNVRPTDDSGEGGPDSSVTVSDVQDPTFGCGGAVYNGDLGTAAFRDVTWFTGNTAGNGGGGGAVCNQGVAVFSSRTYFTGNVAEEDAQGEGGHGGAIYTTATGITTFRRKANFRNNRGGTKGGAVHSAGITTLQRSAVFSGNMASTREAGSGGHVFSSGVFEVEGDATFRSGKASRNGGALFVSRTGDASFNGILEFIDNEAGGLCEDVYDASSPNVCLSVE